MQMDWLWIPFALTAALIQAMRFMVQKQMAQAGLTATGATWARFLYSLPMIWAALWLMVWLRGMELPALGDAFWLWAAIGGSSQILATVFTVMLFTRRNFAVGVTLRKSEVLLTAAVGWALLGEVPGWGGFAAMVVGMVAILMLSGTGDVMEPERDLMAIGSGGSFAQAAARALMDHSDLSAAEIADAAMRIAADICIYTNDHITVETLGDDTRRNSSESETQ